MKCLHCVQEEQGAVRDANIHAEKIDAFLCCAKELSLPRNKPGYHLPLQDGDPIDNQNLEAAFRFLDEQLHAKRLVLVYCAAGFSRSPSIITGYLALRNSESPKAVLRKIRKLRPAVHPSGPTLESVIQYVNEMRWKDR
jgi:protein-tyrosine phosphatase